VVNRVHKVNLSIIIFYAGFVKSFFLIQNYSWTLVSITVESHYTGGITGGMKVVLSLECNNPLAPGFVSLQASSGRFIGLPHSLLGRFLCFQRIHKYSALICVHQRVSAVSLVAQTGMG